MELTKMYGELGISEKVLITEERSKRVCMTALRRSIKQRSTIS